MMFGRPSVVIPANAGIHAQHRCTRAMATGLLVAALLFALDRVFPLPPAARGSTPGTLVVLAADGTPLRSWAGADGSLRQPVTPEEIGRAHV